MNGELFGEELEYYFEKQCERRFSGEYSSVLYFYRHKCVVCCSSRSDIMFWILREKSSFFLSKKVHHGTVIPILKWDRNSFLTGGSKGEIFFWSIISLADREIKVKKVFKGDIFDRIVAMIKLTSDHVCFINECFIGILSLSKSSSKKLRCLKKYNISYQSNIIRSRKYRNCFYCNYNGHLKSNVGLFNFEKDVSLRTFDPKVVVVESISRFINSDFVEVLLTIGGQQIHLINTMNGEIIKKFCFDEVDGNVKISHCLLVNRFFVVSKYSPYGCGNRGIFYVFDLKRSILLTKSSTLYFTGNFDVISFEDEIFQIVGSLRYSEVSIYGIRVEGSDLFVGDIDTKERIDYLIMRYSDEINSEECVMKRKLLKIENMTLKIQLRYKSLNNIFTTFLV